MSWLKTVSVWLLKHVRGSSLLQFMVTGPSGLSGVTVPSHVAVVFRDAGDRVQIHLPAMADGIALENQRSCRAATPEGAQ